MAQAAQQHRSTLLTGLNVMHRILAVQTKTFLLDATAAGELHCLSFDNRSSLVRNLSTGLAGKATSSCTGLLPHGLLMLACPALSSFTCVTSVSLCVNKILNRRRPAGARYVAMLLEPAFSCAAPAVTELLAKVLAQVYSAFPVGPDVPKEVHQNPPVHVLQRRVRLFPSIASSSCRAVAVSKNNNIVKDWRP